MDAIPQIYQGKHLVYTWTYRARDGAALGHVGRYQNGDGKKDIVPFFKRKGSGFNTGIDTETRPLFGLDMLANHPKDKAVFIVEGEKAAAALLGLGIVAVTSLGGSNAANKADWTPLSGFKLAYLLPDNDAPGEHYARDVYAALSALESPPAVKVLRLPDLPDSGDVVDWLQMWLDDWDGYGPIPEIAIEGLRDELKDLLKTAGAVPDDWGLAGLAGSNSSGFNWETPGEIETKTPPVQALPAELIPEPFRPWLADVSHRMQTPPDFAAISAIVIASAIIGAGCAIRPKRFDDWEIIPNLWGACIGRPSVVLKSPSMKEPMALLERLQTAYGEEYAKDKVAAEFDKLANQAKLDDIKKCLAKAAKSGGDSLAMKANYMELMSNADDQLKRRLFKTNETSVQSMTVLQNENPRGLLVFRDELVGLLASWDREDKADERAYYLVGWNGYGSYTDNKIGRGMVDAKNVCISLLGGIQPDKLKRYLYQALRGGNDGLIQRLQLAVWPDEPKQWQLVDSKPLKSEKQRAFNILNALAEMDFTQHGAHIDGADFTADGGEADFKGFMNDLSKADLHGGRPYFRFTHEGQDVFNDWLTELQTEKLRHEEHPLIIEHLAKYRSLMPSLALIFHCIEIADGKAQGGVSERSALLALEWCDYLETHARRVYAMAESPEHEAAVRLAAKIKTKALPSPFTSKAVYDKGWHGLKDKQEVEAACNVLIDENWLMMERKPVSPKGGRPLSQYHINPVFL